MVNCIFCSIVNGDIPADKLYEDDKVVAFKDVNSQAPEHFLVIPKEHISTPNDATDEALLGKLSITASEIAKERGFAEQGYRLVMNCNSRWLSERFSYSLALFGWSPNDLATGLINHTTCC